MREKVETAARELGYRPNVLARSLTTRRTELIGLVSNNFENPAFMEVFDLFTARLQDHARRPLLLNLTNAMDTNAAVQTLLQYSVDGVILASSTLPDDLTAAIADAGLPVVHAFGRYTPQSKVSVVSVDNVHAGQLAARRLLAGGYCNIGFLGGPEQATSTEDRLRGFSEQLGRSGIAIKAIHFAAKYGYEEGKVGLRALLGQTELDAICCGDDILAMGARDECRERGIDVPGDIGLVGFNDVATAAWSAYNLTTVRQPIREIIVAAVEHVVACVEEPEFTPQARLFPCELVERGTLRPLT